LRSRGRKGEGPERKQLLVAAERRGPSCAQLNSFERGKRIIDGTTGGGSAEQILEKDFQLWTMVVGEKEPHPDQRGRQISKKEGNFVHDENAGIGGVRAVKTRFSIKEGSNRRMHKRGGGMFEFDDVTEKNC